MGITAFICIRVGTAVGHFTAKRIFHTSFPDCRFQLWASFCILSYNLNRLFCCVNLLCIVLLSFHCFSALRRKTYVILGFGSMSCHSGFAPLPAEWRKDGRGELQVLNFPASSLSSCPLYPANQGCVIPRQVFLISSHLVALTSVCLSGAANYNDLLFVCRFSSALACLSCSVVVPVMPSRGRPRCLFPTLTKADETSCLL